MTHRVLLALTAAAVLACGCGGGRVQPDPLPLVGDRMVASRLFFGLSKPGGVVSEDEWRAFLRDVVTVRFPAGLTAYSTYGQWQDVDTGRTREEPSRVVLLLHDGGSAVQTHLAEIVDEYLERFDQQDVMRVDTPANVEFIYRSK